MKKSLFAILFSLLAVGASAQDNMTQSAVGLVQSINLNPAARPTRGFVSIPIVGSFQVGLGNSFSYSDIVSVRSDGKFLSLPSLVSTSAANGNSLMTNVNLDVVNVGFYVAPDDFITISVRGRVHAATSYPLGLIEFVSDNALRDPRQYNINASPNVLGWAEVGVGYSRSIGNFTVGARLKYIEGIASLSTQTGVNFAVDKDYDKYYLSADYSINAGSILLDRGGMEFAYGPFRNPGFAIDLGLTWVSNDERITASASVSDLGKIWWSDKSSTELRVRNPNMKFEFDGLGNLLNQGLDFGQLMDSVVTEFTKTVEMDTIKGSGFSTPLPTTFQVMGSYSLGRKLQHNLSLGFIGQLPYRGGFDYAVSVGYAYRSPNKMWQLMANYSYRRNNPLNIGIGAAMTAGPFQLYLATDNIISLFNGPKARNVGVRLGLNFFFGPESVRN